MRTLKLIFTRTTSSSKHNSANHEHDTTTRSFYSNTLTLQEHAHFTTSTVTRLPWIPSKMPVSTTRRWPSSKASWLWFAEPWPCDRNCSGSVGIENKRNLRMRRLVERRTITLPFSLLVKQHSLTLCRRALTTSYGPSKIPPRYILELQVKLLSCFHFTEVYRNQWELLTHQMIRTTRYMMSEASVHWNGILSWPSVQSL